MRKFFIIPILLCFLCGCETTHVSGTSLELTYNHGAQLLAAGNPKSAIPFLSQTVASAPDGPEPGALLSLAFALDLQSEQAILEAQKVHRASNDPPGWEAVAVGIAETVRNRPAEAIASYQRVLAAGHPESPLIPATRQWLALSQIIKGDHDAALATLDELAKCPPMKSTAMLWRILILSHDGQDQPVQGSVLYSSTCVVVRSRGQAQQATDVLMQCAGEIASTFGKPSYEGTLNDQALYDSAIAAIAEGKLDNASQLLTSLQKRETDGGDAALWLALISAAQGHWQAASNTLDEACEAGPLPTRGMANQLCAVIRAMEDRPESMIQHMLAGQRMMSRATISAHVIENPKPESVWFSDSLK